MPITLSFLLAARSWSEHSTNRRRCCVPRLRHFGEGASCSRLITCAASAVRLSSSLPATTSTRRRSCAKTRWLAAGGYREGLLGWEDYDLCCRFAELGLPGIQVPEDLALYRVHDASMLHTLTHDQDDLRQVHESIVRDHPWLQLEQASRVSVGMDLSVVARPLSSPSACATPPCSER